MVEQAEDKWRGIDMAWKGNEKFFWLRLKQKFKLIDPMEKDKKNCKGIWYTQCNAQKGGSRIYCKLDKIYTNKDFFNFTLDESGLR